MNCTVEAGKLALKKTEPDFLYTLVEPNSSNPLVQMSSKMMDNEKPRRLQQKFKNANSETNASKPKIVKIETPQLANFSQNRNRPIAVNHKFNTKKSDDRTPRPAKNTSMV